MGLHTLQTRAGIMDLQQSSLLLLMNLTKGCIHN